MQGGSGGGGGGSGREGGGFAKCQGQRNPPGKGSGLAAKGSGNTSQRKRHELSGVHLGKRAGTSPVNAVVRETIVERRVHFQSSG